MALFADTFYWIAVADPNDQFHAEALTIMSRRQGSPIVTTDEVLVEFLAYFSSWSGDVRREVSGIAKYLLIGKGVRVIPQSRSSLLAGIELYASRPDKGYSLTDCISMETMRREGLREALTNDRHFEQEGFVALFRGL